MAKKTEQGPKPIGLKLLMGSLSKSLRRRLEQYPDLGDEYVKEQLESKGKHDFFFPGIAKALRSGALGTETSYRHHPEYRKWLALPENRQLAEDIKKEQGKQYIQQIPIGTPRQEEIREALGESAIKPITQAYSRIGQELPLASPVNQILQGLAQQYQNEFGRTSGGPQYFSGPGVDAYRNMPPLADIMAALNPRPMVNAAAPYAQSAYNAAAPYAQSAYNAAQPYAQKAGQVGMDALGALQSKAQNLGGFASQGISNLLSMLQQKGVR